MCHESGTSGRWRCVGVVPGGRGGSVGRWDAGEARPKHPGERFVVWVQGCPLACPGCWSPDTWDFRPRDLREVASLADEIGNTPGIEGVTFSGGEPFSQATPLTELACFVRSRGLSVLVFTGHPLAELTSHAARSLLAETDILVAGRFLQEQRVAGRAWVGSANQTVHFLTGRYGPGDLADAPVSEVLVRPDGSLVFTGFPEDELVVEDAVPPRKNLGRPPRPLLG